jgi:hypothetical protein
VEFVQNYINRQFPTRNMLTSSESDYCTFTLGVETVTAINDGGLGIRYHDGKELVVCRPGGGVRPVLSIEVYSSSPLDNN